MNRIIQKAQENWRSGLTVALVSLPLSISLGVAAGATPLMGVITAVWAGLVASVLGGSYFNIVGPTGALSGILANFVLIHGIESLPVLAVISGLFILVVYILRWEKYIALIPSSVIHGFTLGVALIIALNQLNFAFGLTVAVSHERFILNVYESLQHLPATNFVALSIFLLGLSLLLAWPKKLAAIPGPIILAAGGVVFGYAAHIWFPELAIQTLQTKFGDLSTALWQAPVGASRLVTRDAITASLTVAVIAILETLISAKIADGMTRTKHDKHKEILGLGMANIASGILGGIPATAALARTALNVKSGANHRISATINSVVVAIVILLLFPWFQYLPLSIVAAILVYVAIRMVGGEHFSHLYHYDKIAFSTSLVVALITIIFDPIIGILIGATVSLLIFINKIAQAGGEVTVNRGKNIIGRFHSSELSSLKDIGNIIVYRFSGELTYINAQAHLQSIHHIRNETTTVVLSFRNLYYVDIDGLDAIDEIITTLKSSGKDVYISGMNPIVRSLFERTSWYKNLAQDNRVFSSSYEALEHIHAIS